MELSQQIKNARLNRSMTQEQVAKQLFVTRQTISRWETGSVIPPINALYDLAEFYHMPLSELLGEHSIVKNKINFFAIIGSLVFNLFFLSTFGMLLSLFYFCIVFIDLTFIFSPFILAYVNLTDVQIFSWHQTFYTLIFFITGIIGFWPIKKISIFLWQGLKYYFRYNLSNIRYTVS